MSYHANLAVKVLVQSIYLSAHTYMLYVVPLNPPLARAGVTGYAQYWDPMRAPSAIVPMAGRALPKSGSARSQPGTGLKSPRGPLQPKLFANGMYAVLLRPSSSQPLCCFFEVCSTLFTLCLQVPDAFLQQHGAQWRGKESVLVGRRYGGWWGDPVVSARDCALRQVRLFALTCCFPSR